MGKNEFKICSILGHQEKNGKCCSSCDLYYSYEEMYCPLCGMSIRELRITRRDKEKLKDIMQKREEQDRIIRIIKKTK
jgi:predicted amidophosphoribosyltransferase